MRPGHTREKPAAANAGKYPSEAGGSSRLNRSRSVRFALIRSSPGLVQNRVRELRISLVRSGFYIPGEPMHIPTWDHQLNPIPIPIFTTKTDIYIKELN